MRESRMTPSNRAAPEKIRLTVELFGTARLSSGRRQVEISAPRVAGPDDLASALAGACPELIGSVVREDGAGLIESFTFNVNGIRFLDHSLTRLYPGDTILVFSSQAGG